MSFKRSSVVKRTTGIAPGMMTPSPVLHEFDVEENLVAEALAQLAKLLAASVAGEAALQIGVCGVGLHGPERGVVPGVVGEQRLRAQPAIGAGEGDFAAGGSARRADASNCGSGDHEEDQRLAFRRELLEWA